MHRVRGATGESTTLTAWNDATEASRFDQLLRDYFRLTPKQRQTSAKQKRAPSNRKRSGFGANPSITVEDDKMMSPERCLESIKVFLRQAPAASQSKYIQRVFDAIIHQLNRSKGSITVIPRVITIATELFKRSVAFRALVATQTSSFYGKLLEAADGPLANASHTIRRRRIANSEPQSREIDLVLEMIETWKEDFGDRYPPLVAGQAMLVESGYRFPCRKAKQHKAKEDAQAAWTHRKRVLQVKHKQMQREMAQIVPEMETLLVEMNRIFEILVPTLDAFELFNDVALADQQSTENMLSIAEDTKQNWDTEDTCEVDGVQWEEAGTNSNGDSGDNDDNEDDEAVEWESVDAINGSQRIENEFEADDSEEDEDDQMDMNDIVREYGLGSSSYQLTVSIPTTVCEQSADNEVLFRHLADGMLRIRKRFLPLVDDWLHHLKALKTVLNEEAADKDANEALSQGIVQQLQDLRYRMQQVELKWKELKDSKHQQQQSQVQPAVVTLPLENYEPPAPKRRKA